MRDGEKTMTVPINCRRGFTLIEMLIVLAIIAMLLTLALPRYLRSVDVARETILQDNLKTLRTTIQRYYGDTGRYPESLDDLVAQRYLAALPVDPITESTATWKIIAPDGEFKGQVFDVKSGADGATHDGRAFGAL